MKVYLVGEGSGDIGYRNHWCEKTLEHIDVDGWLQPVARNIRPTETLEIVAQARDRLVIDKTLTRRTRPLPHGHGMKALLAKRSALLNKCDVVIYMVDTDSSDVRRWREIVSEITAGFDRLDGNITCIACVPMSASESWLMSDANAWDQVTGRSEGLPTAPETVWGQRNDPQGNHPHMLFGRLCDAAGVPDNRDIRFLIGQRSAVTTLSTKCAQSFVPFCNALLAA
ncbi:hypothetical protein QCD71_14765 [Sphingomonas sp. PsM26]|nr:hypothetical protein [Sphingomonas sp. PsM26]